MIRYWFQLYLSGLMIFPTFFNLSLNFAIRSSWSEPQSARSLVFADCIELLHLCWKIYNYSDFDIDYLVISMCRVISYVVERRCLFWLMHSLDKTLLDFILLHFVLHPVTPGIQVTLAFLLLHSSLLWWKGHLFCC